MSLDPRLFLRVLLNKNMKIHLSDGRVLIGIFLCTDKEANVILGCCAEYMSSQAADLAGSGENEPRILGLAMVPGKHIVSIHVDASSKAPSNSPQCGSVDEAMYS